MSYSQGVASIGIVDPKSKENEIYLVQKLILNLLPQEKVSETWEKMTNALV